MANLLSGRLGSAAGLGGAAQGGPAQNYGSPMPAQSTGSGIFADFKTASGDVRQGKLSIAVLESLVIVWVLFYIYTRNIQGGG